MNELITGDDWMLKVDGKSNGLGLWKGLFLALFCGVLFVLITSPAEAAIVDSGTCGENLTWTLDDTGTLTISGTGWMYDHDNNSGSYRVAPWYAKRSAIKSVFISNGVASISDGAFQNCNRMTNISIPSNVVDVGRYAFDGCSALKSVSIENGVTDIGDYAFKNCFNLSNINIPESVTNIGISVFSNCTSLTSITIPSGVSSIGDGAFSNCSGLTDILVLANNDSYSSVDGVLYNKNQTELYYYPSGKNNSTYTIPNSVTSIGNSAFSGCSRLTEVTIPNSVTDIGNLAFSNCSSLINISIGNNVTNIGDSVFSGCSSLTDVMIPDSVTSIGSWSFAYCSSLTNITLPSNITKINEYTFAYCSSLNCLTIPNGVISILKASFIGCSGLENIIIPANVNSIGERAFENCSGLTSVTILDGVNSIGIYAFSNCSGLKVVTIPSSVTNIDDYAFRYCSNLKNVIVETCCSNGYYWAKTYGYDMEILHHQTIEIDSAVSPTCEMDGLTKGSHCVACGEVFEKQDIIPATGHSPVTMPAVAPTDCRPGLTEGSYCSVCGEILTEQQNIHPLLWEIGETDGQATILRYYGKAMNVSIPSALETFTVREIEAGAFPSDNCPTMVYIPASIQSISPTAFGQSVTIYCHQSSEADYWANENGYTVIYTDNIVSGDFYQITMPAQFLMEYGKTRQLGASVWPLIGNDTIFITSSDENVVSVNGDSLTAVGIGQATITLTAGGKSASVSVVVHDGPTDFAIMDDEGNRGGLLYIVTNTTKQLQVCDVQPDGVDFSVTWSSADESVAVVSNTGEVMAKRPGQTMITATLQNGLTRSCEMIVVYPITDVTFEVEEYLLPAGGRLQVKAVAVTESGSYINRMLTLSSSDETVASVDQQGFVTSYKLGRVTITAQAKNGMTATCTLIVKPIEFVLSLPTSLTKIESEAFAGLTAVEAVRIPEEVYYIADDAFAGSNVIILTPENSYAAQWAKDHGMTVIEESSR